MLAADTTVTAKNGLDTTVFDTDETSMHKAHFGFT